MENSYVVYLNKSYGVWAMDAHTWAEKNNISVPDQNIISEVVFWHYMEDGHLDGKPVYFCKDVQPECQKHHTTYDDWRKNYKGL